MAKGKKSSSKPDGIVLSEPYRLYAKYAEESLLPKEAIDWRYFRFGILSEENRRIWENAKFVTSEGIFTRIRIKAIILNGDSQGEAWLEWKSEELYGIPFQAVRSVWFSRLDDMSDVWYYVEMTRIEE